MSAAAGRDVATLVAVAAVAGIAASLAGCGSMRGDRWEGLGPASEAVAAGPARRCHYVDELARLPPIDRVLAPGSGGSLSLWGMGAEGVDTLTVSIRYGPSGALDWVRVMGPTDPAHRTDELTRILSTTVPSEGQPNWGIRFQILTDGTPVRVLPAVECPAVAASTVPTREPLGSVFEQAEMRRARGSPVEARVDLDDQGRVVDIRITRSSGSRLFDQYVLIAIRDMSFRPRLHDGFPVEGSLSVRTRLGWR